MAGSWLNFSNVEWTKIPVEALLYSYLYHARVSKISEIAYSKGPVIYNYGCRGCLELVGVWKPFKLKWGVWNIFGNFWGGMRFFKGKFWRKLIQWDAKARWITVNLTSQLDNVDEHWGMIFLIFFNGVSQFFELRKLEGVWKLFTSLEILTRPGT